MWDILMDNNEKTCMQSDKILKKTPSFCENRDFIIEKHLWVMKYIQYTSFYATRTITPFLNSRISANNDKVETLSVNGKILTKGMIVSLL